MSRRGLVLAVAVLCGCAEGAERDWVPVSRGELAVEVEMEGTLRAKDSTSVGPPGIASVWEFKIARLAPEGEEVAAGDLLVAFDTSALEEQLLARQNDLEATRTTLAKRKQEMALEMRNEELALAEAQAAVRKASLNADQPEELSASIELRKAALDLEAAEATVAHKQDLIRRRQAFHRGELATLEAQVALAESDVAEIEEHIQLMHVKAERAGTVIYSENWSGEKLKVGDSVWRARNVLEVASLDEMTASGTVDEADAAKLALGQLVRLRLEVHPDSEVTGHIVEIARAVQRKSRDVPTKVVAVKLSIDPIDDLQLRPGMRFRGDVQVETLSETVVIPEAAVFPSPTGPVAYRKNGDSIERVELSLGRRGARGFEVLEGLDEGDLVSNRNEEAP